MPVHLTVADKGVANGVAELDGSGNIIGALASPVPAPVSVVFIALIDSPYSASWGEDINCDCSAGNIAINLPAGTGNEGEKITITKSDNSVNTVTPVPKGSDKILTNAPIPISSQFTSKNYISLGTNIGMR